VQQAISRQLVSDVPLSAYLSGGIDSGAIVAIASSQLPGLRTFTVGFDLSSASGMEIAFDERRAAEALSYACGTEHYEMVLKAGDMPRVMTRLAWHLEEPRVGQSYPNFYAAQLASKFSKVVLSGVGGDELFGGYPWRYHRERAATLDDLVDAYFPRWRRLMDESELAAMVGADGPGALDVARGVFRSVLSDGPAAHDKDGAIRASLYFEAKTFLHGLLVMEDKLSMAHGLENRVPFLDNDLVDFAQRLPVRMKVRESAASPINENEASSKTDQIEQRRNDGKRVLRRAMQRHFPPGVTDRDKQGFSAPDASWFRGESVDYVDRALMRDRALIYEFLDQGAVRRAVGEHLSGRRNRRLLIWSLLSLEEWARNFLAGDAGHGD
jgi:asparagine synthase (glutamine-hydrolysing)